MNSQEAHHSIVLDTALLRYYYCYYYICLTAFFRTTWVSRHQKGKPFWILLHSKRWRGGSGISWTICKSFASHSRQITMPILYHSFFYRPDVLPATQPTASKQWRHIA